MDFIDLSVTIEDINISPVDHVSIEYGDHKLGAKAIEEMSGVLKPKSLVLSANRHKEH